MARPPAGPQGNSPRDVRDDAVGVPAENVTAPMPPRWPPKRKKITSNTFHAKVSGGTSGKRADRAPTFRRGGMVKGFASGGSVAGGPVDKNDPKDKAKLKKGGPVAKTGRFQFGGMSGGPPGKMRSEFTEAEKARRTLRATPPVTIMEDIIGGFSPSKGQDNALRDAIRKRSADEIRNSGYELENKGIGRGYDFKKKGGAVKRQGGGDIPQVQAARDMGIQPNLPPPKFGPMGNSLSQGAFGPYTDRAKAMLGAVNQALPMAGPATAGVMSALGGVGGGKAPGPSTGGLGGADTSAIGGGSDTTVGRASLRRGGAVKKRAYAEGGEIDVPNKPPAMPDKPFAHTGPDEGGPGLREENTAQKIARGINTAQRALGRPMSRGAFDVQKYSDMQRAQDVSDAVPRRPEGLKDGGRLSAAQRQAMPKSDFALPGKGEGPKGAGSGSYPINDPSHARNALARSSGKPEAAAVRAKVKAKYPGIG